MPNISNNDEINLFYKDIESLIKNLLIQNINYSNGYFHNPNYSKYDLLKDTKDRAEYILQRLNQRNTCQGK